MIISTLVNIATTISISAVNPTTIVFSDPVQFVTIGKTGDFSILTNNNKKVVVICPVKNIEKAEMVVLTENKNYQFKIHVVSKNPNNYYQITDGRPNVSYTLLKRTNNYEILEGISSIKIKNLTDKELNINEETLLSKSSMYLPKGGSVYVNSDRIL
jgi:Holliday junction resolvasome RuvABC ATP-dependent DNA helicase subunit